LAQARESLGGSRQQFGGLLPWHKYPAMAVAQQIPDTAQQQVAPGMQSMAAKDPSATPGEALTITALRRQDLNTARLQQVARLHKVSFADQKKCCCCISGSEEQLHKLFLDTLSKGPDSKLDVFGLALDGEGEVLGYVMLGFHDTPGDTSLGDLPNCITNCFKPKEGTCHLEQIVVSEKARGKGIGKQLMTWADRRARERGCAIVHLEVINRNHRAKALYEREGYKDVSSKCKQCWCCPILCCLMRVPYVYDMHKQLGSQ